MTAPLFRLGLETGIEAAIGADFRRTFRGGRVMMTSGVYYRCTDRVRSFPLSATRKERGINARITDLNAEIAELAESRGIPVHAYSRDQVRAAFEYLGCGNKQGLAEVIAKHIPVFERYVPPPRKPWMSERTRAWGFLMRRLWDSCSFTRQAAQRNRPNILIRLRQRDEVGPIQRLCFAEIISCVVQNKMQASVEWGCRDFNNKG